MRQIVISTALAVGEQLLGAGRWGLAKFDRFLLFTTRRAIAHWKDPMPTECAACLCRRREEQDSLALCDDCWGTYQW